MTAANKTNPSLFISQKKIDYATNKTNPESTLTSDCVTAICLTLTFTLTQAFRRPVIEIRPTQSN